MKEFPPFQLDLENECLWRIGKAGEAERIALTPKTFGVLKFLVEHPGRLVSRDELLEAVWPRSVVEPQAVKKHILDARNALGDRPKDPLFIETVSKRGYRFIAPVTERIGLSPNPIEKPAQSTLVGRSRALQELIEGWRCALRGARQIVFITGEPGIGKTALVEEFQRQIAATAVSVRIARGQCVEGYGSKEPYFPMFEALGQLGRGPQADFILKTLATQAPTWLVQLPALLTPEYREILQREILGATRERMLREIADALEAITADSPLLLVFEDLQRVDDSTVDLISLLARRQAPAKLMLLATFRPLELEASGQPLSALTRDLLVHRLCRELDLASLSEVEVAQFLAARSIASDERSGLAVLLHRHTEGNPLFLVAALDHMVKRLLLTREEGEWRLKVPLGQIELAVPDDLSRMIEAQLERLSPQEQNALEVASIAGASFSARLVSSAADADPEALEDLFGVLSRRSQIIRRAGLARFTNGALGERYEFVHAFYRRVLYERQAPGRKARLHQQIGEEMVALGGAQLDETTAELAYHFEASSNWPRAVDYYIRAAEVSWSRCAAAQADSILERARELVSKLPEGQRAPLEIRLLTKLADYRAAELDTRAIETYEMLAARAAHYGLIDVQVRALIDLAFPLSLFSAERCLQTVQRAQQLSAGQDPHMRLRTRASGAALRLWAGGWDAEVAQEYLESVAQIKNSIDPSDLASHLTEESLTRLLAGQYREAYRLALESRAKPLNLASSLSLPHVNSQITGPLSLTFMGEWGEALQELAAARVLAERNENHDFIAYLRIVQAWVHLHAMDFRGAQAICKSALPFLEDLPSRVATDVRTQHLDLLRFALVCSGSAAAASGDTARAFKHLCAASRDMDRQPVLFDWYWRLPMGAGLVEAWLARRDAVQAQREAERLLELSLATADAHWQALAWETNARVALANLDRSRARHCIAKALSRVQGVEVPMVAWRVHATTARIEKEAGNELLARSHGELSRATILKLADSLPTRDPLRATFVSAPAVAEIVDAYS
jgi:DNA-binding winged helix-turn-helix (wHTH) protein